MQDGFRRQPHGGHLAIRQVYGVQNLRVCDASPMPSIPCANTNIPTIMMAERIADIIKNEMQAAKTRNPSVCL
jgi:choline dehydrogenase-like flavoprotein